MSVFLGNEYEKAAPPAPRFFHGQFKHSIFTLSGGWKSSFINGMKNAIDIPPGFTPCARAGMEVIMERWFIDGSRRRVSIPSVAHILAV
ncbi:MAG: hypothetical protein NTX50_30685 [Candidatus Sumerlaeota bacterium]|nr:hypothetical protein [Candidatus Sumerlaeota bacterium]